MEDIAEIKLKGNVIDGKVDNIDMYFNGDSAVLLGMCTSAIADILQDVVEPEDLAEVIVHLAEVIVERYYNETKEV